MKESITNSGAKWLTKSLLAALAVVAVGVPVNLAKSSSASAAVLYGCAQSWSSTPGVCIAVVTGTKNANNHTQWVSQITVSVPPGNNPSLLEAWAGNGPTGVAWYGSQSNSTSHTWQIDRWIKNDSGVCGAYTIPLSGAGRAIACMTIRA